MFAVLAAAMFAPLHFAPRIRTFPELAAAMSATPGEVRCDKGIAHRAAFVAAKSISRDGLLDALDLKLVPDGDRLLLKAKDEAQEREWFEAFRASLNAGYDRYVRFGLEALVDGSSRKIPEEESGDVFDQFQVPLADPKVSPSQKREIEEAMQRRYARDAVAEPKGAVGMVLTDLFPHEFSRELFEQGQWSDAIALSALPPAVSQRVRAAYPEWKGGDGATVVRTQRLVDDMRVEVANLAIVDPGQFGWIEGGAGQTGLSGRSGKPNASFTSDLLATEEVGTLKLRGFRKWIAALRAGEAEGRALIAAWSKEVPPREPSLSQVAARWAKAEHDVILELSPKAENTKATLGPAGLLPEPDWSPRVVEGVLALRPLTRFLDARRRYPYAALRAYEEAKAAGKDAAGKDVAGAFVATSSPADRFDYVDYRGWSRGQIDRMATSRRVAGWADEAQLKLALGRRTSLQAGVADVPFPQLPAKVRDEIAAQIRFGWDLGGEILHSPPAWRAYTERAVLRVEWPAGDAKEATVSLIPNVDGSGEGVRLLGTRRSAGEG